jgi:hypothetical protein
MTRQEEGRGVDVGRIMEGIRERVAEKKAAGVYTGEEIEEVSRMELSINESASLGCFKAQIEEIDPGKEYELTITAQPPFKTGINRTTLKIETNIEKQKRLL